IIFNCAAARANSASASAWVMCPLRSLSASSARCIAARAAASSISLARSAVSASTVTLDGCTSIAPPPTKKCCSCPSGVCTRTSPGLSSDSSGACRGATPMSPSEAGANTIAASPEKICPSALTMSTWMVCCSAMTGPLLQRLRLGDRLVDGADHVEGLLRQRIELAADDALEAADRLVERDDLAVLSGEHLGDVERLRQEALHLARA